MLWVHARMADLPQVLIMPATYTRAAGFLTLEENWHVFITSAGGGGLFRAPVVRLQNLIDVDANSLTIGTRAGNHRRIPSFDATCRARDGVDISSESRRLDRCHDRDGRI